MSAPILFDTHAHLDAEEFQADLDQRIAEWKSQGVAGILAVSTNAQSTSRSLAISGRHSMVWASAGIHPNYCGGATEADWQSIVDQSRHPRVVALGETGLDKYWDYAPFEKQQEYFIRHIRLSQETGLPFIVHMRDCEPEMLGLLQETADQGVHRGIMHSFCGSPQAAERCLTWGMMISFSGMVTYPKNSHFREIVRAVPGDRLLVETDSPWLSPHPHRGVRPNTPALVRHTVQWLVDAREVTADELAALTTSNARRIFGIESGEQSATFPANSSPEPRK